MEFGWTEAQNERYKACVAFAKARLNQDLPARDAAGEFSSALWRRCGEFGVLGFYLPEAYGGASWNVVTTIPCLEGIGYGYLSEFQVERSDIQRNLIARALGV